jgi:hypothetical protein
MSNVLLAPVDIPVDPLGQAVVGIGSVIAALLVFVFAFRIARRRHSAAPVLMVASMVIGSLIEPIYDNAFHILWYIPGQWNLYSALNVAQPNWIWAAYVSTYGSFALYFYSKVMAGATARDLRPAVVFCFVTYFFWEVIATNLGVYEYYGSHPFRIFGFPFWVTPPNMGSSWVTGLAVAFAETRMRGPGRLAMSFMAFPLAFTGVTFGCAFPTLIVISEQLSPTWLTWVAGSVTFILVACTMWLASLGLPLARRE